MAKKASEIKESDLYQPIADYLTQRGFTVKGEVKDCDIMAVKDEELLIVEMKKSVNLSLILQATQRQKLTHQVYVAVIHPSRRAFGKAWKNVCHLLRRLELGLITVSFKKKPIAVEAVFDPAPFDRKASHTRNKRKVRGLLTEFQERTGDYNIGGVTGRKIMTAYREKSVHIACVLRVYGPLSIKHLKEKGCGEKTDSILAKNFYGWFVRVERGVYSINEECQAYLDANPKIADFYYDIIAKIS